MRDAAPQAIQLEDYTPPAFLISDVALDVDIRQGEARVRATLTLARNAAHPSQEGPLVLDGENLELLSVAIDGRTLGPSEFTADAVHLTLPKVPQARFSLQTIVRFDPWKNTRLEGLYKTRAGLVTQCEAEGFRHITYFIDRPDVMAKYLVTICGSRTQFPHLLANGNLVSQGNGQPEKWLVKGDADDHWARWED